MSCSRIVSLAMMGFCLGIPGYAQQSKERTVAPQPAASTKKVEFPLDSLTEFSALMVGGLLGNIDELHIYRSGKLMRTEMLDGNYMVTNLETRDTFVVLPKSCSHDARPSVNTFPFSLVTEGHKIERNPLGTETLDGHPTQVEEITLTPEHGQPMKLKFWEATDLAGFPIRLDVYRTVGAPTTITYKEVKIGPPDPALFEMPAGCSATKSTAQKKSGKVSPPKKKPQPSAK